MSAKDKLIKRAANIKKDTVSNSSVNRASSIDQRYTAGGISSINLDLIVENEKNIRQIDDDDLTSLIESIKEIGLQQNLVVCKNGTNLYKLLSGHRRFRALKILHEQYPKDHRFDLIPCLVVNIEEDVEHGISKELTERMLIATTNIEIESLTKKELLDSVLICEEYYTKKYNGEKRKKTTVKEEIGKKTGLSTKYIYDILKFNAQLIPEFKNLFFEEETLRHRIARMLSDIDEETQRKLYAQFKLRISDLTENEIETYLSSLENKVLPISNQTQSEADLHQNNQKINNLTKSDSEKIEITPKIETDEYQYEALPVKFQAKIKIKGGKREFVLPNELPKKTNLEIDVANDIVQIQPKTLKSAKGVLSKTAYRKYVAAINQISKQFCIIADLVKDDFE